MSDIKTAYKAVALEVFQLCTDGYSEDWTERKLMHRVKAKVKRLNRKNLK